MNNFIQSGEKLTLSAPRPLLSGEGFLVGDIFAVAQSAASTNAPVVGHRIGVVSLAAVTADVAAVGTKAYWDNTVFRVTATVGTNKHIGVFVAAKTAVQTTAAVLLDGVIR